MKIQELNGFGFGLQHLQEETLIGTRHLSSRLTPSDVAQKRPELERSIYVGMVGAWNGVTSELGH